MYSEVLNQLRDVNTPPSLERRWVGTPFASGLLGILDRLATPVDKIRELLSNPEMNELIDSDNITVGMIKPRLDRHMDKSNLNIGFPGDSELAEFMIDQISDNLEPILSVSFRMNEKMLNEFYAGNPKERMQNAINKKTGETRWQEFKRLMASGPVTFIVLHSRSGNAIDTWRKTMGTTWDVDALKVSEPNSLRAQYAIDNNNNILHGSDSIESVHREINFMIRHMK